MSRPRWMSWRRAGPLVAALACGGLLAACGGVPVAGTGSAAGSSTATDPAGAQTDTTTTDHPGVERVEVSADAADVVLRQGADGASRVERTLRWTGTKPEVVVTVDGPVLRVRSSCPSRRAATERCSVTLTVTVPAATAATSDVAAGDVTVADLGGAQDHETSAGDVRASALRAGRVTARTGSGDVRLAFAAAPQQVDAESSAGDVEVRVPPGGGYRVEASTSVGDTTVSVPDDPAATARIVARSKVGDVTVAAS